MARPTSSRVPWARLASSLSALLALGAPSPSLGHGIHGHIHVTGWAIENLPPGELRELFADPEVKLAALAGSMFPDTGYARDASAREYAEYSHWEPFVESFIQKIRKDHGPRYDTQEKKKLIAFLMGAAAHGLQDELFDSTFLFEATQRDGVDQDKTDPGTDGFLVLDGHARLLPGDYLPIPELLPLFAKLPVVTDAALIEKHVNLVRTLYANAEFGWKVAAHNGTMMRPEMPWTSAHYLDFAVPGSLASEIRPTAAYMQAIWDRIHGRFSEASQVIHAWPETGRRLREADHTSVASWVTLIVGKAVTDGAATGALTDSGSTALGFDLRFTRWSGNGASRLVRFLATADYKPGETYSATLNSGASLVDGTKTTAAHSVQFQVECTTPADTRCPGRPEIENPVLDPLPPMPVVPSPDPAQPDPQLAASGCSATPATSGRTPGAGMGILMLALLGLLRRRRLFRDMQ